ncbi:multicopper oxidase domain-containing protein [Streptomyces sp. JNUCC 63]
MDVRRNVPGPTIVSRSGRRTLVRHRNELDRPVVVHLHGGHTPAASDGCPTSLILPANGFYDAHRAFEDMTGGKHAMSMARGTMDLAEGVRSYTCPLKQRAATLWFHDHRMGHTGASVWMGLAGFHLVHDDEEEERLRYRLRFLNASNAQLYKLELAPQPEGGGAFGQNRAGPVHRAAGCHTRRVSFPRSGGGLENNRARGMAAASTSPARIRRRQRAEGLARPHHGAGPATGNPAPGSRVSRTGVAGLLPFAAAEPTR